MKRHCRDQVKELGAWSSSFPPRDRKLAGGAVPSDGLSRSQSASQVFIKSLAPTQRLMSSLSSFHRSPLFLLLLFFLLLSVCLSVCLTEWSGARWFRIEIKDFWKEDEGEPRRWIRVTGQTEEILWLFRAVLLLQTKQGGYFCRLSKGAHHRQKASDNEAAMALGRVQASPKATLWQTLKIAFKQPFKCYFFISLEKKQLWKITRCLKNK